MITSNHVVWSLLASLTFASSALAQTAAASAPPPPAQPAPKDNVADLTGTTLSSPSATSAAAPAPLAPSAVPPVEPSPKPTSADSQAAAALPPPAPPAAAAVDPEGNVRHGFYLRLNQGLGYLAVTGDGPLGNASIKGLGSGSVIAIGASVARGVVLAGTLQASSGSAKFKGGPFEGRSIVPSDRAISASSKADAAFSQIGLLIDWFPNPTGGWHVAASGGVGTIGIVNRADDTTLYGYGFSGTLFGGYDWRIAKEWSLGLALFASGITTSTIKYADGGDDTGYRLHGLSFGVSGSLLYF